METPSNVKPKRNRGDGDLGWCPYGLPVAGRRPSAKYTQVEPLPKRQKTKPAEVIQPSLYKARKAKTQSNKETTDDRLSQIVGKGLSGQ